MMCTHGSAHPETNRIKTMMRLSCMRHAVLYHHEGGGRGREDEFDGGGGEVGRSKRKDTRANHNHKYNTNYRDRDINSDENYCYSCLNNNNNYCNRNWPLKYTLFIFILISLVRMTHSTKTNATQSDIVLKRIQRDADNSNEKRVVCYYTNWSVYRPGTAKYSPQNINPYLCTHLIYAFGGLDRENGLRPYDKYQDIEQGGYAKFTGLKTYNKNLKTMLAIGGWNEGSARFSPLVADEERRKEFVKNVIKFLRQNHFDGLDLDWEYPTFRDGGKSKDRENYAQLVQELREEFDRESDKTGRPRLLLTMAVPAGIEYIDKGYDVPKLNRYLDFMNILSYDYHSAFEPAVNHHSPLFSLEEESEYNFDAQLSIDYTVSHYIKSGADRDKLVLGIPTYGRSFTLFNPDSNQIGAPADGPGEQGDATREKGYLAYYEICGSLKSDNEWKVEHPKRSAMGPYAFKGNQWVGYDDEDIVREKAKYVSEKQLGGIMFWSIDNDDFRGSCHNRPYPLIEAGKEALFAGSASNKKSSNKNTEYNESKSGRPSIVSTTTRRPKLTKLKPTLNRSGTTTQRTSYTQSTTAVTPRQTTELSSLTTPEPPTTPDPGSDFICKDEGFFPHPRDCKKYFWCLDSGPSNLGIVAHQFTCPSGLFFNKAADSCDFARNVLCKEKKEPKKTTTTPAPTTTTAATTTSNSRLKLTAATAKSTGIRYTFTTSTSTTTTTTTELPPPLDKVAGEGEEEDDYDHAEEDPQAIKQLIMLIKKLGGVAELEKQLENAASGGNSEITPPSTISRNLYNKVLTPHSGKYQSPYKNGPSGPQNEGLTGSGDDGTSSYRREKPQYVTITRERQSTEPPSQFEGSPSDEGRSQPTYKSLNRYKKPVVEDLSEDVEAPEDEVINTRPTLAVVPKYKLIDRRRPTTVDPERKTFDDNNEEDVNVRTNSNSSPRYTTIQRSRPPLINDDRISTTSRYLTVNRQHQLADDDTRVTIEDATSSSSSSPYFGKDGENSNSNKIKIPRLNINNNGEKIKIGNDYDNDEEQSPGKATTSASKVNRGRVAVKRPINRRPGSSSRSPSLNDNVSTESLSYNPDTVSPKTALRSQAKFIRRRVNKHRIDNDNNISDGVNTTPRSSIRSSSSTFDRTTVAGSVTTIRPKKFEFPKRTGRPSTTLQQPLSSSQSELPVTSSLASDDVSTSSIGGGLDSQIVESKEELAMTEDGSTSTLPDLANVAVAAIQSLATLSPVPLPVETTTYSTVGTSRRTSPALTILSTTAASDKATSVSFRRGTVRPFVKKRITQQPSTQSRVPTPKPSYITKPKISASSGAYDSSVDYESDYYAAEPVDVPLSGKVRIHNDGYIECLDIGNFPHPFSCKKFISCAKMENGHLLGWEYTCPRGLSFDPIGGICNWSAGLGCKE